MKLNKKEKVYELIESYSIDMKHDEYPKFTTNFLSEKVDMQRTNLSSILNQLVKEGTLEKEDLLAAMDVRCYISTSIR